MVWAFGFLKENTLFYYCKPASAAHSISGDQLNKLRSSWLCESRKNCIHIFIFTHRWCSVYIDLSKAFIPVDPLPIEIHRPQPKAWRIYLLSCAERMDWFTYIHIECTHQYHHSHHIFDRWRKNKSIDAGLSWTL